MMNTKNKTIEVLRLKQETVTSNLDFKQVFSISEIAAILKKEIADDTQENLIMLGLNNANEVIVYSNVFTGTTTTAIVGTKEILQRALLSNATKLIVAHNHPSGNESPSEIDYSFTEKLQKASDVLDLTLIDSLVITSRYCYSIKQDIIL